MILRKAMIYLCLFLHFASSDTEVVLAEDIEQLNAQLNNCFADLYLDIHKVNPVVDVLNDSKLFIDPNIYRYIGRLDPADPKYVPGIDPEWHKFKHRHLAMTPQPYIYGQKQPPHPEIILWFDPKQNVIRIHSKANQNIDNVKLHLELGLQEIFPCTVTNENFLRRAIRPQIRVSGSTSTNFGGKGPSLASRGLGKLAQIPGSRIFPPGIKAPSVLPVGEMLFVAAVPPEQRQKISQAFESDGFLNPLYENSPCGIAERYFPRTSALMSLPGTILNELFVRPLDDYLYGSDPLGRPLDDGYSGPGA